MPEYRLGGRMHCDDGANYDPVIFVPSQGRVVILSYASDLSLYRLRHRCLLEFHVGWRLVRDSPAHLPVSRNFISTGDRDK